MVTKAEKEAAKAAKGAEKEAASVPSERQSRWETFLARHEKQNPDKHALRKQAGELPDEVPAHFV